MDRRKSRLSLYPRYGPRESVFAGNPDIYRGDSNVVCSQFLKECVSSMEDCCTQARIHPPVEKALPDICYQAYEAQEILRQGTYDLPRVSKVLESERVCLK